MIGGPPEGIGALLSRDFGPTQLRPSELVSESLRNRAQDSFPVFNKLIQHF